MAKDYKKNPAATDGKPAELKAKRTTKFISQLAGGIGWVGFTKYQMEQLGINSDKSYTKDLRIKVHGLLKLKSRKVGDVKEEKAE